MSSDGRTDDLLSISEGLSENGLPWGEDDPTNSLGGLDENGFAWSIDPQSPGSSSASGELDENGFPCSLDPQRCVYSFVADESEGNGFTCRVNSPCVVNEEEGTEAGSCANQEGDEESFAEAFYRSGSDFSSLLHDNSDVSIRTTNPSPSRLVQADLFKMWGLKKSMLDPKAEGSSIKQRVASGLMDSHRNRKVRRIGEGHANSKGDTKRKCPFYKKIAGTPFTVDAFRYGKIEGCSGYFLTHFHYDHYGGLNKVWSHGPIYCSSITARLVKMCLGVDSTFICPLEVDAEYNIEGVTVTMLEANHCPGATIIHFRLVDGRCYLHTGDFRACKKMHHYPLLLTRPVSVLYLDTTYCNPKYRFPPKEEVLRYAVQIAESCLAKQSRTLIIVGAYSIGKEDVFLAIAEALDLQIFVNSARRRVLESFGWHHLSKRLSSNGHSALVHVLPISMLNFQKLKQYMHGYKQFQSVVAFRPTGWTYSEKIGDRLDLIKPKRQGQIAIYGIPYSEHSSYSELKEFVQFLRPEKIIPTVNIGQAVTREKMESYFRDWMNS